MAGRALENARRFHELFELSVRDPLTGLHNRHYFHETLAQEVKRAHRYDRRLALIFFDIDDFKAINEEIGHLGGDAVWRRSRSACARSSAAPTSRAAWAATSLRSCSPSRLSRKPSDCFSASSSQFRVSRSVPSFRRYEYPQG